MQCIIYNELRPLLDFVMDLNLNNIIVHSFFNIKFNSSNFFYTKSNVYEIAQLQTSF